MKFFHKILLYIQIYVWYNYIIKYNALQCIRKETVNGLFCSTACHFKKRQNLRLL